MTDINKADQSATLTPTIEPIETVPPEYLGAAGLTVDSYSMTLGLDIAARNPPPYTISNSETGQCREIETDLGSLPQSLGELSAVLSGTDKAIRNRPTLPQKGV